MIRKELSRLRWELISAGACIAIAMLFGISLFNLGAIVFKFMVFSLAVILVHISRQFVFPYINLMALMFGSSRQPPVAIRCTIIASTFFYYVGCVYALTQAI